MVVLSILFSDSPKGPGKRILAFSESLQWFLVWVWVFKVIFWYDIIHCFHQMIFTHAFTAWRKHANCFIIMSTIFYIILGYVSLKTFLCFEFNVFMLSLSGKICDIKLRIAEVLLVPLSFESYSVPGISSFSVWLHGLWFLIKLLLDSKQSFIN